MGTDSSVLKIYIVIPAHNEAAFIGKTLESLVQQTHLPDKIIVVDDQSSDRTPEILADYTSRFSFIESLRTTSSEAHLPGSKVINAFNKGVERLDQNYDILCKFDADLIFPEHYLELLSRRFTEDPGTGMVGGFCYIFRKGRWVLENLTDKDHIRGALKAYRKACYHDIGGLKPSMGWDTADELLAQYNGWNVVTCPNLRVKHLRPTGAIYNKASRWKQGESFYRLRYGFIISFIASVKLSLMKKDPRLFRDYIKGYIRAQRQKQTFLVSKKEGTFIRRLRYKKMKSKLF